jgi:hypothetical protein
MVCVKKSVSCRRPGLQLVPAAGNEPVNSLLPVIFVRDYSRRHLHAGLSPANAFSVIDMISPSQNFPLPAE